MPLAPSATWAGTTGHSDKGSCSLQMMLSRRVSRGEFAAALSSMRALAQVVGPALWGRVYMQLLRTGYPPSWVWVCVAGLGALVPAAVHRSIKGEDWEPKQA